MKVSTCNRFLPEFNKTVKTSALRENIFLYLSLIFAFEPKIFVKYALLNYIFIVGIVVVFLINIYIYFKTDTKISGVFVAIIIYRLSFGITTFISRGDIEVWGYISIVLMSLYMTIDLFAHRNLKMLLNGLINVLTVILTLNLISGILFPDGIKDELFFIGIRTRFTEVVLVDIVLTLTYDKLYLKSIGKKSCFIIFLSIFTVLMFWIATAVIGLSCFLLICLFYKKIKFNKTTFIHWIVFTFILEILIVHVRVLDNLDWLLVDILHKTTSLSGRTGIWDNAFPIIFENPIFGHGMVDNGNFVPWVWGEGEIGLWQAHNQWLQLLYDGGLICVISFVAIIVVCYKKINQNKKSVIRSQFLIFGIIVFYIMMIVEIFSYTPYFFVLPFVMANMNNAKVCHKISREGTR